MISVSNFETYLPLCLNDSCRRGSFNRRFTGRKKGFQKIARVGRQREGCLDGGDRLGDSGQGSPS